LACALTLLGCHFGQALDSDPSAWAPEPQEPGAQALDATAGQPPACNADPPWDATLGRSSAERLSHRIGEACLSGCHEAGGVAKLAFAAAGTLYQLQGVSVPAVAGSTVQSVGGTRLVADACGNFYAIAEELTTSVRMTQPWVQNPTFRRMEKPLVREPRAGDCNQSGCHDFSGRLNLGIYY
jgi:hypothetical protein